MPFFVISKVKGEYTQNGTVILSREGEFMSGILLFSERLISGALPFCSILLCGTVLTVNGGFFQLRKLGASLRLIRQAFLSEKKENGVSSYTAACSSLSATVGTGNIAGVSGAIALGGPGAVFWMWISAFLCMAVKYGEIALAVRFRESRSDGFAGGPMYYIKNGLGGKFKPLAYAFALCGIPAVICTGCITQTNAAAYSMGSNIKYKLIVGIAFTVLCAFAVRGGVAGIGKITEKLVPLMSLLYIALALGVILLNVRLLPEALGLIFKGAFSPKAVTGGAVGSAFSVALTGCSRGVFSNEAGLGTSAIAHSNAFDAEYEVQGLFGIFEVFADTVVICTLTALTILCSGVKIDYGSIATAELTGTALSASYGGISRWCLAAMMCLFGFSSVIGWAVYGDAFCEFLFGGASRRIFRVIYPLFCFLGAVFDISVVWRLSELFNGIMLCINLPVILLLKDYFIKTER